jgi:hypothetical protein
MIFRLKREFAPRAEEQPGETSSRVTRGAARTSGEEQNGAERRGKFKYLVFEDLTRLTFSKMRAISQHADVDTCWSVSGVLKFKLKDSNIVHKVKSILQPAEEIVSRAKSQKATPETQ